MKKDPIIEETRKAGEDLARLAGFDVHVFFNLLRECEQRHVSRVVSRQPPIYADKHSKRTATVCAENEAEYERKR